MNITWIFLLILEVVPFCFSQCTSWLFSWLWSTCLAQCIDDDLVLCCFKDLVVYSSMSDCHPCAFLCILATSLMLFIFVQLWYITLNAVWMFPLHSSQSQSQCRNELLLFAFCLFVQMAAPCLLHLSILASAFVFINSPTAVAAPGMFRQNSR